MLSDEYLPGNAFLRPPTLSRTMFLIGADGDRGAVRLLALLGGASAAQPLEKSER
jgi:hypothetical protein